MTAYVNGAIVFHKKASIAHLTHRQPSLAQTRDGLTEAVTVSMVLVGLCVVHEGRAETQVYSSWLFSPHWS